MGLLRKVVRRATPRPVRKVKRVVTHPVRTGVRAVTPRPIRNAQRTVFNATHPVNTLENAFLNSLTGSPRSRSGNRRRASSGGGGYYSTGPNSNAAAYERAALAEQIQQAEAQLFSSHTGEVTALAALEVPPLEPPDPSAIRAEVEQRIGITELRGELAPFGSPPQAPDAPLPDQKALAQMLLKQGTAGISWIRLGQRRRIRDEARAEAEKQVGLINEHNAAEQGRKQESLDAKQTRLESLTRLALQQIQARIASETTQRETAHTEAVMAAQALAQRLRDNDPETVMAALREALANNRIGVVGTAGDQASVALIVPEASEVIIGQGPAYTPAGRLTLRKRSKTQINRLYMAAIASEVLRITRIAFTTAPGLASVRCRVARENETGPDEVIFIGTVTRAMCSQPMSYAVDPEVLSSLLELFDDVLINKRGRTSELCPLEVGPSVAASDHPNARPERPQPRAMATGHAGPTAPGDQQSTSTGSGRSSNTTSTGSPHATARILEGVAASPGRRDDEIERLVAVLANDPDEDLRYEAISALQDRVSPDLRDAFIKAAEDNDRFVRRTALDLLGRLGDPRDTDRFIAVLANDPDEDLRYEAISALQDRATPELHDVFVNALDDTDSYVRDVARAVLGF